MQEKNTTMRIGLVIPTLNAGDSFAALLQSCRRQTCQLQRCLVVDSASVDGTASLAREAGFEVWKIARSAFNHGRTRQQALERLAADVDIVIFLTQDVQLYDYNGFSLLVAAFADGKVAAAYGRQLPFPGATLDARLSREFNYPSKGRVKSLRDRSELGIKTAFLSDSFSAYRIQSLQAVGGFPRHVDVCEDMYAAARLLMSGYRVAYVSEAQVYHSHSYSLRENFKRYYQTGVFQKKEAWIAETFGKSEGEGKRLLCYQLKRGWEEDGLCGVTSLLAGNIIKYAAFHLGKF